MKPLIYKRRDGVAFAVLFLYLAAAVLVGRVLL